MAHEKSRLRCSRNGEALTLPKNPFLCYFGFLMELYVYQTSSGHIADFRSYLDGRDHSFEDERMLPESDPRWEKIDSLRHPLTAENIGRQIEFVGKAQGSWHELLRYPIAWNEPFDPSE